MNIPMNENEFRFNPSSLTEEGRQKLAQQLFSQRNNKIPTIIRMVSKTTGEEEFLSNEVIYGGRMSFLRNLVKNQVTIPNTKLASLNTALGSNADYIPTVEDLNNRHVCLFCVGNNGAKVGGTLKTSHPDELFLDGLFPLRCRETNDDLQVGGLRDQYGLRAPEEVTANSSTKNVISYYAKAVESVEFICTRLGGDYIPGTSNDGLNEFASGSDVPVINTVISVIFTLDLSHEDCLEFYKATGTLKDGSGFNELGLITALPKTVVDENSISYTDYVGAEVITRFTLSTRPTDENSKGYIAEYAVGS